MTDALLEPDATWLSSFLKHAGGAAQVAKTVRAPLLVSLAAGIALFLPDQTREVYRILAQPSRAYGYSQLLFATLTLVVATFVPWAVGRSLILRYARQQRRQDDIAGTLSRWLPRASGALIPLGVATGLAIASHEMAFAALSPVQNQSF